MDQIIVDGELDPRLVAVARMAIEKIPGLTFVSIGWEPAELMGHKLEGDRIRVILRHHAWGDTLHRIERRHQIDLFDFTDTAHSPGVHTIPHDFHEARRAIRNAIETNGESERELADIAMTQGINAPLEPITPERRMTIGDYGHLGLDPVTHVHLTRHGADVYQAIMPTALLFRTLPVKHPLSQPLRQELADRFDVKGVSIERMLDDIVAELRIELPGGAVLRGNQITIDGHLPETVVMRAPGYLLRDVVDLSMDTPIADLPIKKIINSRKFLTGGNARNVTLILLDAPAFLRKKEGHPTIRDLLEQTT